jgi:FSR family fosmidomycin resistance protein-like MFS transporter
VRAQATPPTAFKYDPCTLKMDRRALTVLAAGHLSVDLCQGVIPAMLPFYVRDRHLSYAAAAGLVLAQTISSSVIQPVFGQLTDRRPAPWVMPAGVMLAGAGIAIAAQLPTYGLIWLAIAVSGIGIAAYHPEGARYTRYASGERDATGMSVFSLGGSSGFASAPLLATPLLIWLGLRGAWAVGLVPVAAGLALVASVPRLEGRRRAAREVAEREGGMGPDRWGPFGRTVGVILARSVLFYGLNTFVPLYWIGVLGQSPGSAGLALATLLVTGAAGTILGGWLADHRSRRAVVVGATALGGPLLLALLAAPGVPAAGLLLVPLGLALYMPSSVLVVLAQGYLPGRLGTASGLTLGIAVAAGGVVTPALGLIADHAGLRDAMLWLAVVPVVATLLALTLPISARAPAW